MTIPNSNFNELFSLTLNNRKGAPIDNMSEHNALLYKLSDKKHIKTEDGGNKIVRPLEYNENSNYSRIDGYDEYSIVPTNNFTSCEYEWKEVVVTVTVNNMELFKNQGKHKLVDFLEAKIKNAENSFKNYLDEDLYSDGTADAGKQIGGLQLLVSSTPTGASTVGGIAQATNSFWQNVAKTASTDFGATIDSTNAKMYIRKMKQALGRNGQGPDLGLLGNDEFNALALSLESLVTLQKSKMIDMGFEVINYCGIDCVNAEMADGHLPSTYNYFLNTDTIYLVVGKGKNWVPLEGDKSPTTQAAIVKPMNFIGNMVVTSRREQGLLINA
jgi:hypothetical protein